jgi:hypothetical protein
MKSFGNKNHSTSRDEPKRNFNGYTKNLQETLEQARIISKFTSRRTTTATQGNFRKTGWGYLQHGLSWR